MSVIVHTRHSSSATVLIGGVNSELGVAYLHCFARFVHALYQLVQQVVNPAMGSDPSTPELAYFQNSVPMHKTHCSAAERSLRYDDCRLAI